jgi:hypothetical protein
MTDDQQMKFVYRISDLICKHIRQEITDDELTLLYNWAYANEANKELFEEMLDLRTLWDSLSYFLEIDRSGALTQVWDRLELPEGIEP